jgi:3-hydroxyacyl-CoA dehydrogenase
MSAQSPDTVSEAQAHKLAAERAAALVKDVPADTPVIPVEHIGVIGAGTMGRGIALAFLDGGLKVTIVETVSAALENAQKLMRKSYDGRLKRGQITPDEVEARLARLTCAGSLEAVAACDLVLEAIFEDMAAKQDLFAKLDAIVKPGAILASNTSYLDIDAMAAGTSRPELFIGMHFFSPANIMKLLEVVRGAKTGKSAIATVMQLAGRIGKVPVLSGVCYGFIANRMNRRRREAAEQLMLAGAEPARIDAVVEGFGFKMGPFATSDMAGLDVGWSADRSTGSTPKEVLCEAGRFGQKNGQGYYDYDAERNRTPSPAAVDLIRGLAQRLDVPQRTFTDDEVLGAVLYPAVNEGVKILAEGIAQRASDIDAIWLNGFGFPAREGGIMFWADRQGLDKVLAGMEQLEARYGPDYAPAELLRTLVAEGRTLASV